VYKNYWAAGDFGQCAASVQPQQSLWQGFVCVQSEYACGCLIGGVIGHEQ